MNEQKDILENPEFESYWLSHANAEAVLEWLKERKPRGQLTGGQISEELQTVLIERNEPLIDLGLALYARLTSDIALRLFRNGDTAIKKALLAGPSVSTELGRSDNWIVDREFGVLKELLQSFDDNVELLQLFFSNEYIYDKWLVYLYERTDAFKVLTDEQWLKAIGFTISNPMLKPKSYRKAMSSDPIGWFVLSSTEHPYHAAWRLFNTVPVNEKLAVNVLAYLGETLAPLGYSVPHAPSDMDVLNTIKRWRVEGNEDKHGLYRKCRAALGRLLEDEKIKDSDDIALRQAFYAGSEWHCRKPEEVRKAFEQDRVKFLDVAIENVSFYKNESVRAELRQCCHDYEFKDEYRGQQLESRIQLDLFDGEVDRLRQQHPQWFPDFDGEIPIDEIGDLSLRAEERLVFLQKQIKAILKELVGTKSEDNRSSRYDEDKASLIAKMKAELDQSNQLILSKLVSVTGWMVFVGIVFAIILIVVLIKL